MEAYKWLENALGLEFLCGERFGHNRDLERMGSCVWNLKEMIGEDRDGRKGLIEEEGDGSIYIWKSRFLFSFFFFFLMKVEFDFGEKENQVFFFILFYFFKILVR